MSVSSTFELQVPAVLPKVVIGPVDCNDIRQLVCPFTRNARHCATILAMRHCCVTADKWPADEVLILPSTEWHTLPYLPLPFLPLSPSWTPHFAQLLWRFSFSQANPSGLSNLSFCPLFMSANSRIDGSTHWCATVNLDTDRLTKYAFVIFVNRKTMDVSFPYSLVDWKDIINVATIQRTMNCKPANATCRVW